MKKRFTSLMIDGERVDIRKSIFGWGVIHPVKIDGKINWRNLLAGGSWWNLLIVAFVIFLILGAINEYSTAVNIANECLARQLPSNLASIEYWNLVP